jgi:hypothetical protein
MMNQAQESIVDILRDFMVAHGLLRDLFESHRVGDLRFSDVTRLVGDREASVLYRLKERCHVLFRGAQSETAAPVGREALFDLAVGELFHEAMKLRENLYQLEVYAPKVSALRGASTDAGDDALFREFAKIQDTAVGRLDEALEETGSLLEQTRRQLKALLLERREDGLIARCLVEHAALAAEVFSMDIADLFAEIYGDTVVGYSTAAHSYLRSAFYAEALDALQQAQQAQRAQRASGGREDFHGLICYAEGMRAFLGRSYPRSVEQLSAWVDAGPGEEEKAYAGFARAAVSRMDNLIDAGEDEGVIDDAKKLVERLAALAD